MIPLSIFYLRLVSLFGLMEIVCHTFHAYLKEKQVQGSAAYAAVATYVTYGLYTQSPATLQHLADVWEPVFLAIELVYLAQYFVKIWLNTEKVFLILAAIVPVCMAGLMPSFTIKCACVYGWSFISVYVQQTVLRSLRLRNFALVGCEGLEGLMAWFWVPIACVLVLS